MGEAVDGDRDEARHQVGGRRQDLGELRLEPARVPDGEREHDHLEGEQQDAGEPEDAPLHQRRHPVVVGLVRVGGLLLAQGLLGGDGPAAQEPGGLEQAPGLLVDQDALGLAVGPPADRVADQGVRALAGPLDQLALLGQQPHRAQQQQQGEREGDGRVRSAPGPDLEHQGDRQAGEEPAGGAERAGEQQAEGHGAEGRRPPAPAPRAPGGQHDQQGEGEPEAGGVLLPEGEAGPLGLVTARDRARAVQHHQHDGPGGRAQAPHVHDEPGPSRRAAEVGQRRRPGQQVQVLQDGDRAHPGEVAEGGGDGPGDDHDAHPGRVRQPQALPGHAGPHQHRRDAHDQPDVGRGEVVDEGGLEDGQRGDAEHHPGAGQPVAVAGPATGVGLYPGRWRRLDGHVQLNPRRPSGRPAGRRPGRARPGPWSSP